MKRIGLVLTAVLAFCATSAFADTDGRYLMLDTGPVTMTNAGLMPNPGSIGFTYGHLATDKSEGLKGYVEYSFIDFGDSTLATTAGNLTLAQYTFQIAGVFALPLGKSGFDVTARFGGSYNHSSVVGTGSYTSTNTAASTTGLIYGYGARYSFNDSFAVNVRYDYLGKFMAQAGAVGADESRISVGLQYNY